MKSIIGYCRVSTQEQGKSRNGLEAQRDEIIRWAQWNNYSLISIVEEVASGSLGIESRPVLKEALAQAKKSKAQIVVSKVDRMSRDAGLIRVLTQTNQVVAIDIGEQADPFVGHIYAGLAEKERKMIGARTKAGLKAAKARGVILGNKKNLEEAQAKGVQTNISKADTFATRMKPTIQRMINAKMGLRDIAKELNDMGIPSPRNGTWQASTVTRLTQRWK